MGFPITYSHFNYIAFLAQQWRFYLSPDSIVNEDAPTQFVETTVADPFHLIAVIQEDTYDGGVNIQVYRNGTFVYGVLSNQTLPSSKSHFYISAES
jgi:hypothetical protein